MTREREDELVRRLEEIRRARSVLITRIVAARRRGERDDAAIDDMERLSDLEASLTDPAGAELEEAA